MSIRSRLGTFRWHTSSCSMMVRRCRRSWGSEESLMKRMIAGVVVGLCASVGLADDKPIYLDPSRPIEARVNDLLPRLTLEEKVALCHADGKFTSPGVPRLHIPKMWMSDGPMGVREELNPNGWEPVNHTDDYITA